MRLPWGDDAPGLTAPYRNSALDRAWKAMQEPEELFGRYKLLAEVARGGMGVVYTARQIDLDRVVCLKILHAAGATGDMLVREALTLAKLAHPNIVPIYDAGVHAGRYYYTMEYVEGRTLHELVDGRPMHPDLVARVSMSIANALAYSHSKGVLHRDIKPRNVLVSGANSASTLDESAMDAVQVRVADFGLALPIGDSHSSTALPMGIAGTPAYMSPEQARGENDTLDERSDIYSVGVVLFELLTGTHPFPRLPAREVLRLTRDEKAVNPWPSSVLPSVDRQLERVCVKAMQKLPEDRYANAEDLAEDLQRYLAGEKVLANPGRKIRSRRIARAAAIAAPLAAAALALLAIADPLGLQAPRSIEWTKAESRIGTEVEVRMAGAYAMPLKGGFSLDPEPGDPSSFEVHVPEDLVAGMPGRLDEKYRRHELVAKGRIESKDGRPVLALRNVLDLTIARPLSAEERTTTELRFAQLHTPREDNLILWSDAASRVGDDVTVEGNVLSVDSSDAASVIQLGFPSRSAFRAIVYSEYLPSFGETLIASLPGRRLQVAGRVVSRDGRPEIHVRLPAQMKVVGEAKGEFAEDDAVVQAPDAASHLNELVTVEGNVTNVTPTPERVYVNLDNAGPSNGFTAILASDHSSLFPDGFATFVANKRVQVAGVVELRDAKPVIELVNPYQVRVLGASTGRPAELKTILVEDTPDHVGTIKSVRARVASVAVQAMGAFVNFDGVEYRNGFYLFIPKASVAEMPSGFDTFFAGREVVVTGRIDLFRGRPQIIVAAPQQITVVPRSEEQLANATKLDDSVLISPEDAVAYLGKEVRVRSQVRSVDKQENFAFINFTGSSSEEGLQVYVQKGAADKLPNGFEQLYVGRVVEVRGTIDSYKGLPNIRIVDARQLRLLPEGADNASQSLEVAEPTISPSDASKQLERSCVVQGTVADIERLDNYAFLTFNGVDRTKFYVFISASAYPSLPDGFDSFFIGRQVCVSGTVRLHEGVPQIIVESGKQLRVVGDGSGSSDVDLPSGDAKPQAPAMNEASARNGAGIPRPLVIGSRKVQRPTGP